jgi:hypothetical protein
MQDSLIDRAQDFESCYLGLSPSLAAIKTLAAIFLADVVLIENTPKRKCTFELCR